MSKLFKVSSFSKKYGEGQLGLVALRDFKSGDVILYEEPLVYVSGGISVDDEEKIAEHKKLFAPKGCHMAWTSKDRATHLGGRSGYAVQITIRMIKHQEDKAKAIVNERCAEYRRFAKPGRMTPSPAAYALFVKKSRKHDTEFWDLGNFERLYVYMSHYMTDASMCCSVIQMGVGYCELSSLINHSCKPNAQAKLIPNKMFVVALSDINEGEEVTISYTPSTLGFATPTRVRNYAESTLGFACKCGYCTNAVVPFGYKEGEDTREHNEKASDLIRSFCCEPRGTQRLALARELFADHTGLFQAGSPEYDIVVAYLISAGVLECVHESAGLSPNMENADILECGSKIMLECTEINLSSDPIWILRATYGNLQVAQARLLESISHSMIFQHEKEKEKEEGVKLTPEELAIDMQFKTEVAEKIRDHLYGFLSNYLMYKEASHIMFGSMVGPLVVMLELATAPSLQSIVLNHAEEINKISATMGINVYRDYKATLSKDRYNEMHGEKKQVKLCKNFLMDECTKGDACPLFHDQDLKNNLG